MPLEMKSVFSSDVSEIGYDDAKSELVVAWLKGRVSAYSGVPPEVANEVMNAASVGSALYTTIKPTYAHRYIG